MSEVKKGRRRRSSSLIIYQEPLESPEHMSDQSALPNLNATWVNSKGILNIYIYCRYLLLLLLSAGCYTVERGLLHRTQALVSFP